jgi:hypothetical protein
LAASDQPAPPTDNIVTIAPGRKAF